MPTRRNIAAALLAYGCVWAAGHAQAAPPAPDRRALRRALHSCRNDLTRAVHAGDIARLRSLITDTFTHGRASGRIHDREGRITTLLTREPVIETGLVLDDWLSVRGPDTAILTARSPL